MQATEIKQLLPEVIQRTARGRNPLSALLDVMELMQAPAESAVAQFDSRLDPRRTSDSFVPLLARWTDLDRLLIGRLHGKDEDLSRAMPSGLGRLRELIANAAWLSKWRGTQKGLVRFLEIATGESGFTIDEAVADEDDRSKPFHIQICVPTSAEDYMELIKEIVESEKPAYVTCELVTSDSFQKPVSATDAR